jgi:hypothetical protein
VLATFGLERVVAALRELDPTDPDNPTPNILDHVHARARL